MPILLLYYNNFYYGVIMLNEIYGFVDLQVNGFQNIDFSGEKLCIEDVIKAGLALYERGTAGFLATIITSEATIYQRNLPIIAAAMNTNELHGILLGIHAEGPFLSSKPGAVGAHNPTWVRQPDIDFFNHMQAWANGQIKLITIAAETETAVDFTRYAVSTGVTVSLGHQFAQSAEMSQCAAAGATLLTHLGNGLPNEINRHHNPIFAGIAEDGLSAMIITDGHHLPPALIKTIIRAKGVSRVIVTSDASSIAGMPSGEYRTLGNLAILEPSGLLHNPEKKCLVGSSATMLQCINYLASINILTAEELTLIGIYNPLNAIKMTVDNLRHGRKYQWNSVNNCFC
jgi:N-acetylglucosamine-6-phosphate deacetylase